MFSTLAFAATPVVSLDVIDVDQLVVEIDVDLIVDPVVGKCGWCLRILMYGFSNRVNSDDEFIPQ